SEYAPGNVVAMRNLAGFYLLQGRFAAAENELRRALTLASDATLYNQLGWAYIYDGKLPEAIDALKSATGRPEADAVGWGSLARAYRWEGRQNAAEKAAYAKALQLADEELRVNPSSIERRANRANLLAEVGRHTEALQEIAATKARAPGDVTVLFKSAVIREL